jgi:hypothetical protein
MSVTVRTKGSNSSKIVLEFYIQFEYSIYSYIIYIHIYIINVVSCPPGALIWKIKYLVSCILYIINPTAQKLIRGPGGSMS